MAQSNRIQWIDALKGIGITTMVIAHQDNVPLLAKNIIFSFHMPLFFIVSGYLINFEKYRPQSFFKSRSQRLLGPYAFGTLLAFIYFVVYVCPYPSLSSVVDILKATTAGAFYGIGLQNRYQPLSNIPASLIWFLPALFITDIIFFFTGILLRRNIKAIMIVSLGYTAAGMVIGRYIFLPWSIDIALAAQVFLFFGYALRNSDPIANLLELEGIKKYLLLVLLLIIWIYDIQRGGISMNNREYHSFWISFPGAIAAVIFLVYVLRMFMIKPANDVLQFLGYNSLVIYTFQIFAIFILPPFSFMRYHWALMALYITLFPLMFANIFKFSPTYNRMFFK